MGILAKYRRINNNSADPIQRCFCKLSLFIIIGLSIGCVNEVRPDKQANKSTLTLDSISSIHNYNQIISDAVIENGFAFALDSLPCIAYFSRDNKLILKSVFTPEFNLSFDFYQINDIDPENEIMIAGGNDSLYFFLFDKNYYISVPLNRLLNNKPIFKKHFASFLNFFEDSAYISKSGDVQMTVQANTMTLPYRLKEATNPNLIDSTALLRVGIMNGETTLKKLFNYPAAAYKQYQELIKQVYAVSSNGRYTYYTNKVRDSIGCYDAVKNYTYWFAIPETTIESVSALANEDPMDYSRRLRAANDINIKMYTDSLGNCILIK